MKTRKYFKIFGDLCLYFRYPQAYLFLWKLGKWTISAKCVVVTLNSFCDLRNVRNENKIRNNFSRMSDDIRPPVLWRRPNAKTYSYNQVGQAGKCIWLQNDLMSILSGVWGQLLPAHDQLYRHQEQAGRVLWAPDREDPSPRLSRDLHGPVSGSTNQKPLFQLLTN